MSPPRYQPLLADDMGKVTLADGAGEVRIIAGSFGGVRGPATTVTPIDMFDVRLRRAGTLALTFAPHENVAVLVIDGEVTFNGQRAGKEDFVLLPTAAIQISVAAASDAHLLVLAGEPIEEPWSSTVRS